MLLCVSRGVLCSAVCVMTDPSNPCLNYKAAISGYNNNSGAIPTELANPWICKVGVTPTIFQSNLVLPSVESEFDENGCVLLSKEDCASLEDTWGFCLLAFFAGRFLGRKATRDFVSKWQRVPSISFHKNG